MIPAAVLLTICCIVAVTASPVREVAPRTIKGKWTDFAAIGTGATQEHGTAATESDIYILGGIPPIIVNNGTPIPAVTTVSAYSLAENEWKDIAPLPLRLTHINAAMVDGKIYVLGGLDAAPNETVWRAVPDCFVYDPTLDEWTVLPPMPAEQARGASAVGIWGQNIYLAGGMRSLAYVPGGLQDPVDTVTAYNVGVGEWTTLPSLPAPRDHVGGATIGRTFFVVGGRDHGQVNVRDTNWAMDLDAPENGWIAKAPMPTARGGLSIGVITTKSSNYIATFGGEGNPAEGSNGVFNETEVYDVGQDTWTELDPMPHPRHGTTAASVGGRIWIPGGGIAQGAGPVSTFDAFELL